MEKIFHNLISDILIFLISNVMLRTIEYSPYA